VRVVATASRKSACGHQLAFTSVRYRTAVADGTPPSTCTFPAGIGTRRLSMNAIIYLVGLVVVVMFILSLVGLR
jgi:hypothetical protein